MQASNGETGDFFGRSLYTDGSTLLVGAPGAASVYVYERTADGAWEETGQLSPEGLGENVEFAGASARGGYRTKTIAMVGDRIAVTSFTKQQLGLRSSPSNENAQSGAVHIFKKSGDAWVEESVLRPDDASVTGFAYSIAGEGNHLIPGAPTTR